MVTLVRGDTAAAAAASFHPAPCSTWRTPRKPPTKRPPFDDSHEDYYWLRRFSSRPCGGYTQYTSTPAWFWRGHPLSSEQHFVAESTAVQSCWPFGIFRWTKIPTTTASTYYSLWPPRPLLHGLLALLNNEIKHSFCREYRGHHTVDLKLLVVPLQYYRLVHSTHTRDQSLSYFFWPFRKKWKRE